MTQQPRTPTTAAGRKLLERESLNSRSFALITAESILAIEAEARADLLAQIEKAHGLRITAEQIEAGIASVVRDHFGTARDEAYVQVAAESMVAVLRKIAAIRSAAPVEPAP